MKSINKQTENMGGVLRLWAIPKLDITVSGDTVTFATEDNIVDIYVREDSATFAEELSKSFDGSIYKVEISAVVPCDNSDTLKTIEAMERHGRYVVIYTDGNGNYKLAGTVKAPLHFKTKATTGIGAAGLNHYAITFSGNQFRRAIFIENPFA